MNTCDEGIINIEGSHKSCSNSSSMSSINGSQFKTSLGYDSQQQMKIHRTLKILGVSIKVNIIDIFTPKTLDIIKLSKQNK